LSAFISASRRLQQIKVCDGNESALKLMDHPGYMVIFITIFSQLQNNQVNYFHIKPSAETDWLNSIIDFDYYPLILVTAFAAHARNHDNQTF
jgi:hypothetical protein